jgi:multidrug efflux pump subunit AcrB
MFTLVGGKVWGLYTYEIANEGEINLQLVPRGKRRLTTVEYIERIRPLVSQIPIPGGSAMVMQMQVKGIRKVGEADIEVKLKGMGIGKLYALAEQTAVIMKDSEHLTNVHVSTDMTKPEYQVLIDRTKAAEMGVTIQGISESLRSLIGGAVATRYRDGNEYYNIRVLIPESEIASLDDVANLPLESKLGGYVRIRDVAQVASSVGPVEIVREDQVKEVIVRGDAIGASVGQALKDLEKAMEVIEWPGGYVYSYGGQAMLMKDMRETLLLILGFSIFLSFIVLAVQFDSFKLPALILGSVPFCLAGLSIILFATGIPLGATVIIGVLIIVAVTVNDGVLLLTFANDQLAKGVSVVNAVIDAAVIRLRPRVMTTLTITIGFLPLALAMEEGSDMLQPMAMAAIGGLLMEIFVALVLMPCLFVILYHKKQA